MDTKFASPDRSSDIEIMEEFRHIAADGDLLRLFNAVAGVSAILNANRQIVYVNRGYLAMLGIASVEELLGKRPGESVSCEHAFDEKAGCGTADACRYCGAILAILESVDSGSVARNEARIVMSRDGANISLDLMVTASPLEIRGCSYTMITLDDIGDKKRLRMIEKIFFHDMINISYGLSRALRRLHEMRDKNEGAALIEMSNSAGSQLLDEITAFRDIRLAENGDLDPDFHFHPTGNILRNVTDIMRNADVIRDKSIVIDDDSADIQVFTDRNLLSRVLINMIKNAIEASSSGDTVGCRVDKNDDGTVRFSVKNRAVMNAEARIQIFHRSFSTKGKNRGLGTYSMKLIGERYLGGSVGFTSVEGEGTVFFIDLPADEKPKLK